MKVHTTGLLRGASAAALVGLAAVAHAASTNYWIPGGNGKWSSSTNWSDDSGGGSGMTVSSGDQPTFDFNSGTGTVTTTYDISAAGFNLLGLQEYSNAATLKSYPDVVVNDPTNKAMTFIGNPPIQNESNAVLTVNAPVHFTGAVGIRIGPQTEGTTLVGTTPGVIVLNGPVSLGGDMFALGDAAAASSTNPYGNLVISGNISGKGDNVTVDNGYSRTNRGYVELGAANTFTGGVIVDHATLVIANGTNGSATGSGAVTLNDYDSAIAGTGTISGPITLHGGISITAGGYLDATANPADGYRNFVNSTGTLTLRDGLRFVGESSNYHTITMNFDVKGSANSQLALTGGTFAPSYGDTVNVTGGRFTKNAYDLINYAGSKVDVGAYPSLAAIVNTWTLTGTPAGWKLFNDTANKAIGIERR